MAELEAKVGAPFEHEAKLKSLTERQEEIVKALDLTRNQASNKLEAAVPDSADAVDEKTARAVRHRASPSHTVSVG